MAVVLLYVCAFALPVPESYERGDDAERELQHEPVVAEIEVENYREYICNNPYPPLLEVGFGEPPCAYDAEGRGDGIEQGIGVGAIDCETLERLAAEDSSEPAQQAAVEKEIEYWNADDDACCAYEHGLGGQSVEQDAVVCIARLAHAGAVLIPRYYAHDAHYYIVDIEGRECPCAAVEKVDGRADAARNVKIPHVAAVHDLEHKIRHECHRSNDLECMCSRFWKKCKNHN